jgi:hypothetical protein
MLDDHDSAVLDRSAGARMLARSRIATWLTEGPAQLRTGTHAGAVAGCVNGDGTPAYVYPEITGYFLQWLAWRSSQGAPDARLAPCACAAQAWLVRWAAAPLAATRVHLDWTPDWRNDATFTFDLAMVLRGVGSAARAGLIEPDAALVARLDQGLVAAIGDDGLLEACRTHRRADALPKRWSTRRGPFLAKAAAGVLAASQTCSVSERLRLAAAFTLDAMIEAAALQPHAQTHPRLYAIEGALAGPGDARALEPFAVQLGALLDAMESGGGLPEGDDPQGADRLDVRAQALRIGCVLRAAGIDRAPSRAPLEALADSLLAHVTGDGGMPFAAGETELNVWTAMFAEQALAWLDGAAEAQWIV